MISEIPKRSDGRTRNRPTKKEPGENLAEKTDGRRSKESLEAEQKDKKARQYQLRLSENIRILRTSMGMSQIELARRMGWFRTTVIRLETGERCPSFADCCVLAEVLGVSVGTLSDDITWLYQANNAGTLAETLRRYRLVANMSQEQVSEKCGIGRTQYVNIESGRSNPDAKLMAKLTKVFNRPIANNDAVNVKVG
jgi:putative transcriptional regulator